MMKTILVPLTGDPGDLPSLETALRLARVFSAHIDALHVRVDPIDTVLAMSVDSAGVGSVAGIFEKIERDAAARAAAVKRSFEEFCAREKLPLREAPEPSQGEGCSAQWHLESGKDAATVAAFGRTADLVVVGRGVEHDVTNRSVLETALLETGRPLLIPGGTGVRPIVGGSVAVAWKPAAQAARAVAAAMPLLALAAEIVVLTVDEGGETESTDRLLRHFAWHGLRARAETVTASGRDPADALLATSAATCGLLVMGGYGHSRVREWVFGGFTERVLQDAPLPVLLAH